MEIYYGNSAHSKFALQKLLEKVSKHLHVDRMYSEYVHFVKLSERMTESQSFILKELLDYGEQKPVDKIIKKSVIVVPRFGTTSPWSTKATNILHKCGLYQVDRIERGVLYFIDVSQDVDLLSLPRVINIICDKMTETAISSLDDVENMFIAKTGKSVDGIPLLSQGHKALKDANSNLGLSISEDEINYICEKYYEINRDPTDAELMMFAQANSEHCRHKVFNASWEIDGESKSKSLFSIIKNTKSDNAKNVLSAYSDNSAVIEGNEGLRFFPNPTNKEYEFLKEDIAILMKVETHNHPTAIAPFAGAATGSGGEIRDEGATGRGGKPKAGLTGFSVSELLIPGYQQEWEYSYGWPDHIASSLDIMIQAPLGAASFNNEFGRPNLCGYFRTFFAELKGINGKNMRGYHKPIMLAGGYGNIRKEHVSKNNVEASTPLIVLGGAAMEIGLGGGAASSVDSSCSNAELDFASVQRGNPEMERRCQEVIDACWQLGGDNPIEFIHDVGAGGLSNALPELVNDNGLGGYIYQKKIPIDDSSMSPLAIWCNESQERYVIAVKSKNIKKFTDICERECCPFAIVGESTLDKRICVFDDISNNYPVDMAMDMLFGHPPKMHFSVSRDNEYLEELQLANVTVKEALKRVLRLPTVASKSFLITIGDRSITGLVARDQMVGPWQVPIADCAVTLASFYEYFGEAMAVGERAPIALIDAKASARMAVGEAITNIASSCIEKLSDICLSANWMAAVSHGMESSKLYDAVYAVGMELCPELGITIPVGKDSLSMKVEWNDEEPKSVVSPLSLIISAFAPVLDVRKTVTPQLQVEHGDTLLLLIDLGLGKNRLGGSALAQVYKQIGNEAPDLDNPKDIKSFFNVMQSLILEEKLLAYHDRSDGGVVTTLLEMAFAGHVGLHININDFVNSEDDLLPFLFNEELGGVIQIKLADKDYVLDAFLKSGLQESVGVLGTLSDNQEIKITYNNVNVIDGNRIHYQRIWSETSYQMQLLRDNTACAQEEFDNLLDDKDVGLHAYTSWDLEKMKSICINTGSNPKIAILREQGVNGQTEMAVAFKLAGFTSVDIHMTDLIKGSVSLDDFSGLVACGGFSYGDVLGAGMGWAKSILFNAQLLEEFQSFFERDDTFSLGICNGCQMFSKLKEIIPKALGWPSFVKNKSEQFESRSIMLRIEKSPSLFLSGMAGDCLPIPVAHGEGRVLFSCSNDESLIEEHELVTCRYVDANKEVTTRYPYNPNGSENGITGLTTTDGRVTIMMPHPERGFKTIQHSWYPASWGEFSPWMKMFHNARSWLH